MIKILTGWSNPGGSTVAHINLVNLFNSKGIEACLYGPHVWASNKCNFAKLETATIGSEDSIIFHFYPMTAMEKLPCKKVIYSCHETNVMPMSQINTKICDIVHFVSESQKKWHNYKGKSIIIPNVVKQLIPKDNKPSRAGVIGSIDRHKQTHLSIERAWNDGYKDILLFGNITDIEYFNEKVRYWIEEGIAKLAGHVDNQQDMYDLLSVVYHSSQRETFNYIKEECRMTNTRYDGLPSAESNAEYWNSDKIFFKWLEILS